MDLRASSPTRFRSEQQIVHGPRRSVRGLRPVAAGAVGCGELVILDAVDGKTMTRPSLPASPTRNCDDIINRITVFESGLAVGVERLPGKDLANRATTHRA